MGRECWICDTAYQILNAVNYVFHEEKKDRDLFVGAQFFGAEETVETIRKTQLFSHVYLYYPKRITAHKNLIKTIIGIRFPKQRLKSLLEEDLLNIDLDYDKIFISLPNHFAVALIHYTGCKNVAFFEDGTGSYYGNIGAFSTKSRAIYHLLGWDLKVFNPRELWLNNVKFYRGEPIERLSELPPISSQDTVFWKLLRDIFGYHGDDYYKKFKVIFLSQPTTEYVEERQEYVIKVGRELLAYGQELLVRLHPRETSFPIDVPCLDDHRDMWELVCACPDKLKL